MIRSVYIKLATKVRLQAKELKVAFLLVKDGKEKVDRSD
jgi:hypothetical protein